MKSKMRFVFLVLFFPNSYTSSMAQDNDSSFIYQFLTFSYDNVTDVYRFNDRSVKVKLAYPNVYYYQLHNNSLLYYESSFLTRVLTSNLDFKKAQNDTLYGNYNQTFRAGWTNWVLKYKKAGGGINVDVDWSSRYLTYIEKPVNALGVTELAASPGGFGIGFGMSSYYRPAYFTTWQGTLGYRWQFDARNAPRQTVHKGVYIDNHFILTPAKKGTIVFHIYHTLHLSKYIDQKRLPDDFEGTLIGSVMRLGISLNMYKLFKLNNR